ncbi:DNA replication ATP-dependent helicase/nuclease DNA2 [Harmonia axyridis]|uniref:DNA replication ATP-dependent helicase/nuclease DNA2 n=1 Tax=Harmonia axyridis TaxID=115357 RepID=UPI001E2781B5|nr:DNA replication ATP-dependent helicase/nuclease DNA2 [Harmonia axyridis]
MKKVKVQKSSKTNSKPPTTLSDFFKKIEEKKQTTIVSNDNFQNISREPDTVKFKENNSGPSSPKKRKNDDLNNTSLNTNCSKRICLSNIPSTSTNSPPTLINIRKLKNNSKTPEKHKNVNKTRTPPPKLFHRTPTKVSDFSVNIIENFIKITPSKSSAEKMSPSSSGKIRTTPLKHCSPSVSNRSIEAQKLNEKTPRKETPSKNVVSPASRVKAKLNFGDTENNSKSSISETEGSSKQGSSSGCDIKDILSEHSIDDCFSNFFDNEFEEELLTDEIEAVAYEKTLDLSESKYCKVIKIEYFPSYNKVTIKSNTSEEYAVCILRDFWFNINLEIGDKLYIMAKKIESDWIVDNKNGLIVYEPDLLISSTSVVGALFCKRRSVLSDKFQGFEAGNEFMLVGTLVHSILQQTLKNKLKTISEIENILENILKDKDNIKKIYESDLTVEMVKSKMAIYIPRIQEFVESYVQGKKKQPNKNVWQGKIDEIEDIEENIWCQKLGIKGKVDVTIKNGSQVMPLELKTGKSSFSLEHKGQVLLYIMMMNKLGYKVSSGLLLYLKDGIMREIPISENEKRDIMILRNELAYYLRRKPKTIRSKIMDKIQKVTPSDLPSPINHHSACGKCSYNIICSAFLEYNKDDLSDNKSLKDIKDSVLSHLTEEHINYFILWSSLVNLEEVSEKSCSKPVQDILIKAPTERETKGRCICNLKISETCDEMNGIMNHTFVKCDASNFNFIASGIEEGNYCVVSTDTRHAVVSGFVTYIDAHSITVALDKDLKKKHPSEHFHIDTYESSYSHAFNQTCLTLLLEPSTRADHLRSMVIDKKLPTFSNKLPKVVAVKGLQILKRLNSIQRKAVLKAISANDYLLIKGMPGTGKTATIVALVELLSILGKTVLITSHTHSAVDNICVKLCKLGVDFMRLGSQAKINTSLEKYSEYFKTKDCITPEQLSNVYENTKIIAVTCLGSGHPILSKRTLDVCIVDESTQVLQPTLIRPLYAAKVFILVGDPQQLPPVVRSADAVELGMAKSMFERLEGDEGTISLTMNYRMNKVITKLANDLTYNGNLLVADEKTGNATLCIPNEKEMFESFEYCDWMKEVLDTNLMNSVKLIDTGPIWNRKDTVSWRVKEESNKENKFVANIYEAAVIYNLIQALLKGGVKTESIGVIATYTHQVKQLSCIIDKNIDVSTVDRFQGRDKDVIIYSCTKSTDQNNTTKSKFEILEDHRRLNVALTRAKHKLILIGDMQTVKKYSPFAKLLSCFEKTHIIKFKDEDNRWTYLLNNVTKMCS